MNRLALVTGGSGFIGHRLTEHLLKAGWDVVSMDVQPFSIGRVRDGLPGKIETILGDVADEQAFEPLGERRFDAIFHLAGNANVPGSVKEPMVDFRSNVLGTLNVLELARRTGAMKIVFPSSSSVYRPGTPLPIPETAPVLASSPYGAAKIACENYCHAYFKCYGMNVTVLRFFNVYGPGMRRWVIYDIVQKLLKDPTRLVLLGDGRQVREYLYVDDAVSALVLGAERGLAGEVYNAGTGEPIAITDLAKEILDEMGMTGTPIEYTMQSWPGDIPAWYADTAKFGLLGFRPSMTRKEGLRRTIGQILESEGHPGL